MTEIQRAQRAFYGRRKGRRLRPNRETLVATLLPAIRAPLTPEAHCDPSHWFARPMAEIWLEIGFGSGEHLAYQAVAHPDIGMIGAEVFINGIAGLLARIDQGGIDNIRIHPDDARPLIDQLKARSLDKVFVLFPDPWPKRRHEERRLLCPATLDKLARLMRPGAELRFASDDPVMIAWGLRQLCAHPAFEWLAKRPEDWRLRTPDWPATRYEAKAISQGRRPCYFRFRRRLD